MACDFFKRLKFFFLSSSNLNPEYLLYNPKKNYIIIVIKKLTLEVNISFNTQYTF
jgi:hypothetical protein